MVVGTLNTQFILAWRNDTGFANASFSSTWIVDSSAGTVMDLQTEISLALNDWIDPVMVPMSSDVQLWYVYYRWRTAGGPFEGIDELGFHFGGSPGVSLFVKSLLIKKYTGSPPRYKSGRAYIPFLGAFYNDLALFDDTDATLVACANQFATSCSHGSTTMVPVVQVGSGAVWAPVVQAKPSQFPAWQRRRSIGKRYYEFP